MSRPMAHTAYLVTTLVWCAMIFTILQPAFNHLVYSKCVWRFGFTVCDRILGVEGSYRLTFSIVMFYIVMCILTININHKYSSRMHQEYWILKFVLFVLTNLSAFLIPLSRIGVKIAYNVFLSLAIGFMLPMFLLALDLAHAYRLRWLRWAHDNPDKATCYMCTWLFLIHLTTSVMYAMSFNLIMAFFFFNDIKKCYNSMLLLLVNVFICVLCICLSYFRSLQKKQAASQILFATLLFFVTYSTWLAISDPDNEWCNMYGTIFSGSLLDNSINFRTLISIFIEFVIVLFLCYQDNGTSYINSLLFNGISSESVSICTYSQYHLNMAGASCFFLLAATNFYEPIHSFLHHQTNSAAAKSSTIYFEGYNRFRFILLCAVSSLIPLLYLTLIIISLTRDCMEEDNEQDDDRELNVPKESPLSDMYFIEISREMALRRLKQINNLQVNQPEKNERGHLVQCFYIKEMELSFWHFPRHVSQTYFNGRNGSNACTIIAIMIGRYFSRSDVPFQNQGPLHDQWFSLMYNSINDGNRLYDSVVKDYGVLDLSIEEVYTRLAPKLNMRRVSPSLAVSFESDVESATILYQLERLVKLHQKQVVLFIHKSRTSAFLIYQDGRVMYTDSHAFGSGGALITASYDFNIEKLIKLVLDVLGYTDNRLSTLTVVEYEDRYKS